MYSSPQVRTTTLETIVARQGINDKAFDKGGRLVGEDSTFRRDSRIEIVLTGAPTTELLGTRRSLLRDAANPPRR